MKRTDRVGAIIRITSRHPNRIYPLSYFSEMFGAAKSSISEDVSEAKALLETMDLGRIETIAGARGGIRFLPGISAQNAAKLLEEMKTRMESDNRTLGGGFYYTSDLMFDSEFVQGAAEIFASRFLDREADYVVTIETKGIPVAMMTAHMLNLPLVVVRRDSRVSEGSTISINYFSGSSDRIQKMSLSKRAVQPGTKAIIIDDFMRAGGSLRGLREILNEFDVTTVGCGVVMVTREPEKKRVDDFLPLLWIEDADEEAKKLKISINSTIFA